MTVDEGKWFSKMLASRKTFAEHTKLNKRPLYPVILSKILCKSASICRLCGMKKMQNEPNFAQRTSSIKHPVSRIEQILQNEPNLQKTINEQRTMNYELLSNEPNLYRF